ncbi:MAG TPA: hypothetical protein V6D43_17675 [Candidatus Sericytochromatia bacterium]
MRSDHIFSRFISPKAIAPHLTFPPKRRSLFYHLTTQEPRFCQYW